MKLVELALLRNSEGKVILARGEFLCPMVPPVNLEPLVEFDNVEDFELFVQGLNQALMMYRAAKAFGLEPMPITDIPDYVRKAFEEEGSGQGTGADNEQGPD